MLSYWEKKHLTNYDTLIIGAGLAGLFTALFLKMKNKKERILIVDQGGIPTGASTKNAGFACMGSLTELEDDLQKMSEEEIILLFEKRYKGLHLMRQTLGDDLMDYRERGSYELLRQGDEHILDHLDKWNKLLKGIAVGSAFEEDRSTHFGFKGIKHMIRNKWEGEIDSGLLIKNLLSLVSQNGVLILSNTRVDSIQRDGNALDVFINGVNHLKGKRVIVCTNGFTSNLLPELQIKPARGQVLITKPINTISFKGTYHMDRGYYYFREIDGRVLFGGGRQLDIQGEETSALGENKRILDDLKEKLTTIILPNTSHEIEYNWSGIMAFGENKLPISQEVERNLWVLAGFGGMGVALAPLMAKELVDTIG